MCRFWCGKWSRTVINWRRFDSCIGSSGTVEVWRSTHIWQHPFARNINEIDDNVQNWLEMLRSWKLGVRILPGTGGGNSATQGAKTVGTAHFVALWSINNFDRSAGAMNVYMTGVCVCVRVRVCGVRGVGRVNPVGWVLDFCQWLWCLMSMFGNQVKPCGKYLYCTTYYGHRLADLWVHWPVCDISRCVMKFDPPQKKNSWIQDHISQCCGYSLVSLH